jgi:hypothetical protein
MPLLIERRTQDLHALQDHLGDVAVAVRLCATFYVRVEYENIHPLVARWEPTNWGFLPGSI